MGRAPCCEKKGLKKGQWSPEEDEKLISYIRQNGHPNWRALPKHAGLLRCGKSCRLRWINYLRPDIKRGNFSPAEEDTIIHLHQSLGNRWSAIAAKLPGRTDNEIKNIWHTHLKKRLPKTNSDTTNPINTNSDTKGSDKKRVRKRKTTKNEMSPKKMKLEEEIYEDHNNNNMNELMEASRRDSIILAESCGSEMSSITSTNGTHSTDTNTRFYANENEINRGMENVGKKDDYFGDHSHTNDDFWMEMLSIEDTAISTHDLSFVCDNPLLVEPIRFESSLNADDVDVDLFWNNFFDKI